MLLKLFTKYKEVILYLYFGVMTTVINIAVYYCLTRVLGVYGSNNHINNYFSWLFSNVLAWLLAITFAYITNKIFVFESRSWALSIVFVEATSFLVARVFSFGVDLLIVWFGTDIMHINDIYVKITSNIVVIVLNYVASKLLIFKKEKN